MHEVVDAPEPELAELLAKLAPVDLVLVEGFKQHGHAKIEVHRAETGATVIAENDATIRAMASDISHRALDIPSFDLNDTGTIADFILASVGLGSDIGLGPLKDDCFALPAGVNWVPVDEALAMLQRRMKPCVGAETVPVSEAQGRVLAADVAALRSNPPGANSAVDGYGFAHSASGVGSQVLPLAESRAAAGAPFDGALPVGQAVRIFTGALLPQGVDTVVLQEDVTLSDGQVSFTGPVKPGANTRMEGEDIKAGAIALNAGQVLRAPDVALLSATGSDDVPVFEQLRVGVLSTGDEIVPAGQAAEAEKTYDANRPMLLALAEKWGYRSVDLGHVGDDQAALRERLNGAAKDADVILTSGGASAGDEDHMGALLQETGAAFTWRIAIKPGRPLALAMWRSVPIFGLPGNPVAALICTLIFARPAMSVLAGAGWNQPQGFEITADFEKIKKPGRREFLRARLNGAGRVEVFQSEGSGRISGLSWADGLVELGDGACHIRVGDPVRYIPYSSFGI